jgi:hypothetical protein
MMICACAATRSRGGDSMRTLQLVEKYGAPDRTRTCDPRLRRPVLYPTELRARASQCSNPEESTQPARCSSVRLQAQRRGRAKNYFARATAALKNLDGLDGVALELRPGPVRHRPQRLDGETVTGQVLREQTPCLIPRSSVPVMTRNGAAFALAAARRPATENRLPTRDQAGSRMWVRRTETHRESQRRKTRQESASIQSFDERPSWPSGRRPGPSRTLRPPPYTGRRPQARRRTGAAGRAAVCRSPRASRACRRTPYGWR